MTEILAELRRGHYAPAAWLRFLDRSWRRSIEDARNEPELLRSALRQSALLAGVALAALLWRARRQPCPDRFRQARRVGSGLLLQQRFVVLHLGMTQTTHATSRHATLGAANFLTLLRGKCAILLLNGHPADLPGFALLCAGGGVTDALDGAVARHFCQQSRMGQMLDPAMDVCFYGAAVKSAIDRGALPPWFGWVVAMRFLLPSGGGLYRYFLRARPLEAAHTAWGEAAACP